MSDPRRNKLPFQGASGAASGLTIVKNLHGGLPRRRCKANDAGACRIISAVIEIACTGDHAAKPGAPACLCTGWVST